MSLPEAKTTAFYQEMRVEEEESQKTSGRMFYEKGLVIVKPDYTHQSLTGGYQREGGWSNMGVDHRCLGAVGPKPECHRRVYQPVFVCVVTFGDISWTLKQLIEDCLYTWHTLTPFLS